jgi:hypothetical protein
MKYIFALIVFAHGLIHGMGFAKAFGYAQLPQLTKFIPKPMGLAWLLAGLALVAAGIGFLGKKDWWPLLAIGAALLSQVVIISSWKDAKWGTLANVAILAVAVAAWGSQRFEQRFAKDVKNNLAQTAANNTALLTEADMAHLPPPVQRYLRYCGVVNQPKVRNMRLVFTGQMRSKGKDWFPFTSVQYNFFDEPTRLFFMKASMFGTTVPGYHCYQQGKASMDIRLWGLFSVTKVDGPVMDKTETVTLFNDMCLLAPATLIDQRIQWQGIDSLSAKAIFTNGTIQISAILYFNPQGQLIDFLSDDRFEVNTQQALRFSTPVKSYQTVGDRYLIQQGAGVWHYPDGPFEYGIFNLRTVEYNVASYRPK